MPRKTRLLIVEDEVAIRTGLTDLFVFHGYEVEAAADGREGLRKALGGGYDLLLLDVMLPGVDGFEICNRVRAADPEQPIVMLTAKTSDEDIVRGLTLGADDYVAKPFSTHELMARIRAVLRRRAPESLDAVVVLADLRLDPATRRVTRCSAGTQQEVRLGPTEFKLLHFLMTHPERVHSRSQLLDRVWGDHVFIEERTVDVHVKRLRDALSTVQCAHLVETVRGAGYRISEQAHATSA